MRSRFTLSHGAHCLPLDAGGGGGGGGGENGGGGGELWPVVAFADAAALGCESESVCVQLICLEYQNGKTTAKYLPDVWQQQQQQQQQQTSCQY